MSAAAIFVILLVGGHQVLDDTLEVGVLVGFLTALNGFFDPIQQLSQLYTTYQSGMAALDKIFELLDEEPDLVEREDAVDLRGCAARSASTTCRSRIGRAKVRRSWR